MFLDGLDTTDQKILKLLIENARLSYSEISEKVGLSRVAVKMRINAMEERGIISGYQGSKPREVLMSKERLEELKMGTNTSLPEENE